MYIGPWQEYRLAKIQDDAIQRLRKEWEDQLREQIPEGDEARIRELMQPMIAKLPSLLLASKSKSSAAACSTRCEKPETSSSRASSAASLARPSSSQSVASSCGASSSSTSCRIRDESMGSAKALKQNNQETHEGDHGALSVANTAAATTKQPSRPPELKKKKKATPQLTALEEVQRRKKMFSKWIKTAATTTIVPAVASSTSVPTTLMSLEEESISQSNTVGGAALPRIHQYTAHGSEAGDVAPHGSGQESGHEDFRLPPIRQSSVAHEEWEFLKPYEPSQVLEMTTVVQPPDLEDSLDEDEVNNLLNWTDTLLSPNALDFPSLDNDDLDLR